MSALSRLLTLSITALLLGACAPQPPSGEPAPPSDGPVSRGPVSSVPTSEPAPAPSSPASQAPIPPLPERLEVAVGGGGGFAGSWSEVRMHADGWVVKRARREPDRVLGHVKPGVREALWKRLHKAGYFAMKSRPGNMSTQVAVVADGKRYAISQEEGGRFDMFANQLRGELAKLEPAANTPKAEGGGLELAIALQPASKRGKRPEGEKVDRRPWSPVLVFTVTNRSQKPLRVPNGRTTASYMHKPFGLPLEVVNAAGQRLHPDPGAGGPAFVPSAEHFTTLAPGKSLTIKIGLGSYGNKAGALWRTPGVYIARARLRCAKDAIPRRDLGPRQPEPGAPAPPSGRGGPTWHGETGEVVLTFRTE